MGPVSSYLASAATNLSRPLPVNKTFKRQSLGTPQAQMQVKVFKPVKPTIKVPATAITAFKKTESESQVSILRTVLC